MWNIYSIKISNIYKIAVVLFFLLRQISVQGKEPVFILFDAPLEITTAQIATINKTILHYTTEEQVLSTVDKALARYRNYEIVIRKYIDPFRYEYLTYRVGDNGLQYRQMVKKKGSKGNLNDVIRYKSQFESYFGDSILIIDTLKLYLDPIDFKLRDNGFSLAVFDDKDASINKSIYVSGRVVTIPPLDTKSSAQLIYTKCALKHTDVEVPLAIFSIAYLHKRELQELENLKEIMQEVNKNDKDFNDFLLAEFLFTYSAQKWGNLKIGNILDWLHKSR